MLIGAHVSPAGGPAKAIARGIERGANAIQIFNQNPRAWKPRDYSDEEVAQFRAAMAGSPVDALLIHAVYLLNCATEDAEMRANTLRSLVASLQAGAALGAHAVVLHPGSAKSGDVGTAITRAGEVIAEALAADRRLPASPREHGRARAGRWAAPSASSPRSSRPPAATSGWACAWTPVTCWHPGTRSAAQEALAAVLDDCVAQVGLERLGSLHLNDSQTPLGSNVDRHANIGEGELGEAGCAVFLSEPRFDGLPLVLETPGVNHSGPTAEEILRTRTLRERGRAARRG